MGPVQIWRRGGYPVAVLLVASCGVARPSDLGTRLCPDFQATVLPILQARCESCHSGVSAKGGFRTEGYFALFSRRDDGSPRVTSGEDDSPVLMAARGALSSHPALPEEEVDQLSDWVVRCRAGRAPYRVHDRGWAAPTDAEQFHGRYLRNSGNELSDCRRCHGEDLRGGRSGVDCNSCHSAGPLACNTCHGGESSPAPPRDLNGVRSTDARGVGAHEAHVTDRPLHRAYSCATCHRAPQAAEDEGHFVKAGRVDEAPAEVSFGAAAGGEASWDPSTLTCAKTRCHDLSAADAAAKKVVPVWTQVGRHQADCGTCHGLPPSTHAWGDCAVCHGAEYAQDRVSADRHANGTVDVGSGCSGCHGGADSPTPFRDLRGKTISAQRPAGAHEAHLRAGRLRGPIACAECHAVPQTVLAPGHIDSAPPAEVFPSGAPSIARMDRANPAFNASTGVCSNVYCHGAGDLASRDQSLGLKRTPSWTGTSADVACGSCHGLPPTGGLIHSAVTWPTDCANCHGLTIRPDGTLIFHADPTTGQVTSTHLNGEISGNK